MKGALAEKDTVALERLQLTDFLAGLLQEAADGKTAIEELGEGVKCLLMGCVGGLKLVGTSQG